MPGPIEKPPGLRQLLEQALSGAGDFGRGLFYSPTEPMPEDEGMMYGAGALVGAAAPFLGATKGLLGGAKAAPAAMRGLQGAMGAERAAAPAVARARAPIMQLMQERPPVTQIDPGMGDVEGLIGQLNQGLGRAQSQSMTRAMRSPVAAGAQSRVEGLSPGAMGMANRMFNESRALGVQQPPYNPTARMLPPLPPGVNPITAADLQPRSMEEAIALAQQEVAQFGRPPRR